MKHITAPDARIVANGLDPYQTTEPAHQAYHQRNRARGRMAGQIRMRVRYKGLKTPWFDYLFVSLEELEDLLDGTGWRLAEAVEAGASHVVVLEKV
jgi:hypothetical protein